MENKALRKKEKRRSRSAEVERNQNQAASENRIWFENQSEGSR